MQNFVQTGENLTLPAPYDLSSGDGALVGNIFGVAAEDASDGETVDLVTKGVFTLPKLSTDVFAIGGHVYWDNTNKRTTATASGNTLIGVEVFGAAADTATASVRLNGTF